MILKIEDITITTQIEYFKDSDAIEHLINDHYFHWNYLFTTKVEIKNFLLVG